MRVTPCTGSAHNVQPHHQRATRKPGGVGSVLIQLANRRKARTVAMCSADKRHEVAAIGAQARALAQLQTRFQCGAPDNPRKRCQSKVRNFRLTLTATL